MMSIIHTFIDFYELIVLSSISSLEGMNYLLCPIPVSDNEGESEEKNNEERILIFREWRH